MDEVKVEINEVPQDNQERQIKTDSSLLSPYSNFTPKVLRYTKTESNSQPSLNTNQNSQLRTPFTDSDLKITAAAKNVPSQFPLPNGPQVVQTGRARKKVGLEPGYSPLDWARLISSGVDLRGVDSIGGITLEEIAKHKTQDDVWCAIRGVVYNLTSYAKFHPGGVKQLMRGAGKDATELYNKVHPWVSIDQLLKECVVGFLIEN